MSIVPGFENKSIWVDRRYQMYFHPPKQAGYVRVIIILLTQGPREIPVLIATFPVNTFLILTFENYKHANIKACKCHHIQILNIEFS